MVHAHRLDSYIEMCDCVCPSVSIMICLAIFFRQLNNGILSGLVAICAGGPMVEMDAAFVIGLLSSVFYLVGVALLER